MALTPTPLERAFELAHSGDCRSIDEIRDRLKKEGLRTDQITGPTLLRQLREICRLAAPPPSEGGGDKSEDAQP